jgi:flagellar protein FliJ
MAVAGHESRMKAFEFRLERIADYRRQQAELARNELQKLTMLVEQLTAERNSLEQQGVDMRASTMSRSDLTGQDLMALSAYEDRLSRTVRQIENKKADVSEQVDKQRSVVLEAERNVKLLDRLRDRKFQEWQAESDRELDALAADSHMARLSAARTVSRLVGRGN